MLSKYVWWHSGGEKKKVIDLCSEELKISLEIKRLNTEEPDDATKKQVAYLIDQG